MQPQFQHFESPKIELRKAKFMKEVWDTIIIGIILVVVNKATSGGFMWCKIPIFIMFVSLFFKGIKLFGQITKERMKSRKVYSHYDAGSTPENTISDRLELDDLVYHKKEGQKLWKESDLVKSNLS